MLRTGEQQDANQALLDCVVISGSQGNQHGNKVEGLLISAVVRTTLLFVCESWTVYQRYTRQLNHFHTTCLRRLLKYGTTRWLTQMSSPQQVNHQYTSSWWGRRSAGQAIFFACLMSDERIPKQMFYGELSLQSGGDQRKRFRTQWRPP